MESLKNNNKTNAPPTAKATILKNTNNNIIISKSNKKEKDKETKKEDNPMTKSMVVQNPKKLEFDIEKEETNKNDKQKVNNINNIIYDVNNNINDIINKINSNIGNDTNSTSTTTNTNTGSNNTGKKEVSVTFNVANDNGAKKDKKLDEEKKELRLSKAMQRIKKKQGGDGNSASKLRKSNKVSEMAKELESKMSKRSGTLTEGNDVGTNNEVIYDEVEINDNDNVVNVLKNQQLSKSIKKKKVAKAFVDDNE